MLANVTAQQQLTHRRRRRRQCVVCGLCLHSLCVDRSPVSHRAFTYSSIHATGGAGCVQPGKACGPQSPVVGQHCSSERVVGDHPHTHVKATSIKRRHNAAAATAAAAAAAATAAAKDGKAGRRLSLFAGAAPADGGACAEAGAAAGPVQGALQRLLPGTMIRGGDYAYASACQL